MFRAAYRLSSAALTVYAASGLHTHVVTGRSQVWVGTQWIYRIYRLWASKLQKNSNFQIRQYVFL